MSPLALDYNAIIWKTEPSITSSSTLNHILYISSYLLEYIYSLLVTLHSRNPHWLVNIFIFYIDNDFGDAETSTKYL